MEIGLGNLMDFQTEHFGEECEQWLSRVGTGVEMNGIAQGDHTASLSFSARRKVGTERFCDYPAEFMLLPVGNDGDSDTTHPHIPHEMHDG
jgi:hypothetical protein